MSDGVMTYEDWLRGCVHHDGRHGYVTLPCDKVLKIADFIERLRADHKTDLQTETKTETQNSNLTFEKRTMRDCYNCKRYETEGECIECHYEPKDKPTISKMEQVEDKPQTAECPFDDPIPCEWVNCPNSTDCPYKQKTEPQTERSSE